MRCSQRVLRMAMNRLLSWNKNKRSLIKHNRASIKMKTKEKEEPEREEKGMSEEKMGSHRKKAKLTCLLQRPKTQKMMMKEKMLKTTEFKLSHPLRHQPHRLLREVYHCHLLHPRYLHQLLPLPLSKQQQKQFVSS